MQFSRNSSCERLRGNDFPLNACIHKGNYFCEGIGGTPMTERASALEVCSVLSLHLFFVSQHILFFGNPFEFPFLTV
jgi:hypothetical protein